MSLAAGAPGGRVVDRRAFLAAVAAVLAAPLAAEPQQAGLARVGLLSAGIRMPAGDAAGMPAFEQALRERGWVAGTNVVIAYRFAEEKFDRLPALAVELVRLDPHVIVTLSMAATRAAKDATSTIPLVMWGVANPIGEGLIRSFARPGGNLTGYTGTTPFETFPKLLQLLKEAVPRAHRIAYLWNPANPAARPAVKIVQETARTLGVELTVVGARVPEEFSPAFRTMVQARVDALFIYGDVAFVSYQRQLADLALKNRLPTICHDQNHAEAGGLMSYSVSRRETVRRVAGYVDRILRGAKTADLAVEQPTKFELLINLKTAEALGLTIPPSLFQRADQVIE